MIKSAISPKLFGMEIVLIKIDFDLLCTTIGWTSIFIAVAYLIIWLTLSGFGYVFFKLPVKFKLMRNQSPFIAANVINSFTCSSALSSATATWFWARPPSCPISPFFIRPIVAWFVVADLHIPFRTVTKCSCSCTTCSFSFIRDFNSFRPNTYNIL